MSTQSINRSEYTWSIHPSSYDGLFDRIKHSKPGNMFKSDTFHKHGFKWHITLFPNGTDLNQLGQLQCYLSINPNSFPQQIANVEVNIAFKCGYINNIGNNNNNTNITSGHYNQKYKYIASCHGTYFAPNQLSLKLNTNNMPSSYILSSQCAGFIIKTDIQLIAVRYKFNKWDITNLWLQNPITALKIAAQQKMKIEHEQKQQQTLNMLKQIQSMQHRQSTKQMPQMLSSSNFSTTQPAQASASGSGSGINMNAAQVFNTKQMKFNQEISGWAELFGKKVTDWVNGLNDKIVNMEGDIQQIKQLLTARKMKMDGTDMDDRVGAKNMYFKHKISAYNGHQKSGIEGQALAGQLGLKLWLEKVVGLGEYYGVFIMNGIENVDTMRLITEKELDIIGINKLGHRLLLLDGIRKLNHCQPAHCQPAQCQRQLDKDVYVQNQNGCNQHRKRTRMQLVDGVGDGDGVGGNGGDMMMMINGIGGGSGGINDECVIKEPVNKKQRVNG